MSNVTITEIEDAAITAVKNQCGKGVAAGGYVRTIDTYNGEFDGALEELTVRFPCVLFELEDITARAMAARGTAATVTRDEITLNVFLGAENLRSEKKARRGTHGIYEMYVDVRIALEGQQLDLAIGAFDFESISRALNMPGITVYQMIFKTFLKYEVGSA